MTQEITEAYVQELLTTGDAIEGSQLIPKKIYDTLIQDMEKTLIPRSEAAIYLSPVNIPGTSVDINLEQENRMDVRLVAEGAEIWLDQDEYTYSNIKPLKYGVAIKITKELQEDAQFPLLARNIAKAGARLAENETSLILTQLQGCTNAVTGGAAITIANIATAILNVNNNDFKPTDLLIGFEVLNDLQNIDTFVEADKAGNTELMSKGFIGTIFGCTVSKFSTNAAPSTTYARYAYVFDRTQAYGIAIKRDVSIENFTLPSCDMEAAAITQRISVALLRAAAVSNITTT